MQLDRIALHLRRRTPWEALDLGHAMLRRWWRPLLVAWLATYWPAAGLLLLCCWSAPEYALLLLWWLKPLFDRVLLFVCSRSAFAVASDARDVWRELPRLLRSPGVLSGLTLRRLSLARSFLLPVWQLEGQRGAAARQRFRVLGQRGRGQAVWLTFFCAHMSLCLLASLFIVLLLLTPGDSMGLPDWFADEHSEAGRWLTVLLFVLAETVIEPLYVASGFSLYLNRRSELEGWDIELGLRRLAERRSPVVTLSAAVAIVLIVVAPCSLSPVAAAERQQPGVAVDARSGQASAARQAVDAVLADPIFGEEKDDWSWRWRDAGSEERAAGWLLEAMQTVNALAEALAELLRTAVWWLAALAMTVAVALVVRQQRRIATASTPSSPLPPGTELRSSPALPLQDVAAVARDLLHGGSVVAALSLLYRGALSVLADQRQIVFRAGDTEGECLQRVAGHLPAASQAFLADLVDAWRRSAYGGQHPETTRMESLIDGWCEHFGRFDGMARS